MRPEELPVDYVLKRRDIVAEARKWIGTPYRHQGRSKRGLDCSGLLLVVTAGLGHPVDAPTAHSAMPQGHQLLKPCNESLWKPDRQARLIPGDIAVFWGWHPAEPQHFAFIGENSGRLTIIQSFSKYDKVVEQQWNRFWESKFHCLYVLPGTEEEYA